MTQITATFSNKADVKIILDNSSHMCEELKGMLLDGPIDWTRISNMCIHDL